MQSSSFWIGLLASTLCATAASAQWRHLRTDDPNSVIAGNVHLAVVADDSLFKAMFRCEAGDTPHLQFIFITDFRIRLKDGVPPEEAEKQEIGIAVTVDGGPAVVLRSNVRLAGNDHRLGALSGSQNAADLIPMIGKAHHSVTIALQAPTGPAGPPFEKHTFGVEGSTEAMQELASACDLAAAKL